MPILLDFHTWSPSYFYIFEYLSLPWEEFIILLATKLLIFIGFEMPITQVDKQIENAVCREDRYITHCVLSRSLLLPTMEMGKALQPTAGSVSFLHVQLCRAVSPLPGLGIGYLECM